MIQNKIVRLLPIILLIYDFSSCKGKTKPFKDEGRVFLAAPMSEGIGSLSFSLYDDNRYQIINSGGLGADYYQGTYSVKGDTIILNDLADIKSFKFNRLFVIRYSKQDSSFWQWKYGQRIGISTWQDFKWRDSALGKGDVYQLDQHNKLMKDEYHFIVRLDSLRNYN